MIWREKGLLSDRRRPFTLWGYLIFFVWSIALAIFLQGIGLFFLLGITVAFSAIFCEGRVRPIRRWGFWFLIASTLMLSTLFIGDKEFSLLGLGLSPQGFWVGLGMALRGVVIMLAMTTFSDAVSVVEITHLFEAVGLKGLGFALGVAFNMVPTIQETIDTVYQAIRLRGGFHRQRLATLKTLAMAVVINSVRHGDEIVDAAQARAFNPDRRRKELPYPTWADLALGMALLSGVCILTG